MSRAKWKVGNYRSGLEKKVADLLAASLLDFKHEYLKIPYTVPETKKKYLVDFWLPKYPKLIIEVKGQFTAADRKKMLLVQEQRPNEIVVMLFGRAQNVLRKGSKTTYAEWCDKNGIKWIDLADFERNPERCLSSLIPKRKSGTSKISRLKRSPVSSISESRRSSRAKAAPTRRTN